MRSGGRTLSKHDAFRLGLAPALIVLGLITIAPAIYLLLTSLAPLNLTLPDTARVVNVVVVVVGRRGRQARPRAGHAKDRHSESNWRCIHV